MRYIANGNGAGIFKNQTVRVNVANLRTLATRGMRSRRFVTAYRETARWFYSGDDALKLYADWLGITSEGETHARVLSLGGGRSRSAGRTRSFWMP
jgi:NitT/TauT family transport system substrate-binding protein